MRVPSRFALALSLSNYYLYHVSFIIIVIIIIIIVVDIDDDDDVVVVESELYEHPVACMSSSKLRGKRRVKETKKARCKFYLLKVRIAIFETSSPSSLRKHSRLKCRAYPV